MPESNLGPSDAASLLHTVEDVHMHLFLAMCIYMFLQYRVIVRPAAASAFGHREPGRRRAWGAGSLASMRGAWPMLAGGVQAAHGAVQELRAGDPRRHERRAHPGVNEGELFISCVGPCEKNPLNK